MKIECRCGRTIADNTDGLSCKAHVIGDKNYFGFLDAIDAAIENTNLKDEQKCMAIRTAVPSQLACECDNCGRLYFNDGNKKLVEYTPQSGKPHKIFDRNDT